MPTRATRIDPISWPKRAMILPSSSCGMFRLISDCVAAIVDCESDAP